ncbi:MAG: hypothetical protein R2705_18440 [Ilumatobacteraceae bacterium]
MLNRTVGFAGTLLRLVANAGDTRGGLTVMEQRARQRFRHASRITITRGTPPSSCSTAN